MSLAESWHPVHVGVYLQHLDSQYPLTQTVHLSHHGVLRSWGSTPTVLDCALALASLGLPSCLPFSVFFFQTGTWSPSWLGIYLVAKDDLKFLILLPPSPRQWSYSQPLLLGQVHRAYQKARLLSPQMSGAALPLEDKTLMILLRDQPPSFPWTLVHRRVQTPLLTADTSWVLGSWKSQSCSEQASKGIDGGKLHVIGRHMRASLWTTAHGWTSCKGRC